ncbi:MAG: hypothetical protein LH478_05270 [Chitinophagaceae bacterium]|nr:hypothetical protein [Chitinophagaceae bacterium]
MDKKKHGLTEQQGDIILNESGTFITTDRLDGSNETKEKKPGDDEDKERSSSAGPEEKDITD